jgi:ABC-type glycerol-3-phosphate transport system substrate-binding protein
MKEVELMSMNYLKKVNMFMIVLMSVFFVFSFLNIEAINQDETTSDFKITLEQSGTSYQVIYAQWLNMGLDATDYNQTFYVDMMQTTAPLIHVQNENAYQLEKNDLILIDVDVPTDGLYEIWIDYLVLGSRSSKPLLSKRISHHDGEFLTQYNEDNEIRLNVVWEKESEEPSIDRYGDEIAIRTTNQETWIEEAKLFDPAGIIKTPLKNYLIEGSNTIEFKVLNTVDFYIKSIRITNSPNLPSYETYLSSLSESERTMVSNELIQVNAEDYKTKGATNITTTSVMQPHMSRYAFNKKFMNAVTLYQAGQWIEYEVDVETPGLYQLAIKGEMTKTGLPVFRRIYINGVVPFDEFNHLRIDFQTRWANHILEKENTPFQVYLKKGINTIKIESSPGLNEHFVSLQAVLNEIQNLNMEITSLTGGIIDTNRTWKIEQYIPDIVPRLRSMSETLYAEYDKLTSYSTKTASQFNVLIVAAEQLDKLADEPDDLIEKLYLLNVGSSSSANLIAAALTGMLEEPMVMDAIYVYAHDVALPKANSNWFVNAWEQSKMFVFSFFDPRYDIDLSKDPEVVKVWVRRSKLHVDLMQRMTDELFTPETGIEVELIVLQNESRLVLANAAGKTPDVALSVGNIFDYASRGMLADMRIMSNFQQAASQFNPNTFVPYIYEQGVYGMPETQDVALLYYRKDILNSLDLDVPETWEDVLQMLPLLQSLGMNFYHPISGTAATKSINHMSPLIYQYGGEFYGENANEILIRNPKTVDAIKYMIDLYNIYNLPLQIGSFYERFRNGTLPIGIGDQNMYIQLKYAAPEIIGQWDVAPIPGMKNELGEIERWDTALGSAAVIFNASSNKERAWEFVKWWTSSEIQSEFSHELVTNFGDMFLYMTANIEGFETSSWPEDSKDAILEQWQWIRIPPRLPGYYMLEREISNVYNKAVFEQKNYRSALDEAYFNLEREINRKLAEFGFGPSNPYIIPNNQNIEQWIGGE